MRKKLWLFTGILLLIGCKPAASRAPDVLPAVNMTPPPSANFSPAAATNLTTPRAGDLTPTSTNATLPPRIVQGPYDIWIKGHEFSPGIMTVPEGTTVTWINTDSEFHTVSSETGLFGGGLSYTQTYQFTFTRAGSYNYHCDPHPDMSGTIYVK